MSLPLNIAVVVLLIAVSAFFSVAEIALASARKLRLQSLADAGDARAAEVIALQERPGHFFTVVQIGLNSVAASIQQLRSDQRYPGDEGEQQQRHDHA